MKHPYRMFLYRLSLQARQSFGFMWLVLAAGYLIFSASQAAYHNYQSQQETQDLRNRLASAEKERERLQALIVYYNTDAFKEKELRRALLLKKPGETVYALPESNQSTSVEEETIQVAKQSETLKQKSPAKANWGLWVDYLLHR